MNFIIRIVILITLILALGAGAFFLHTQVIATRDAIAQREKKLEAVPEEAQRTTAIKKELLNSQVQIAPVVNMIVKKDALAEVVAAISQTAVASGVSAQVPQVGGSAPGGAAEGAPTDLLEEVRIHLRASGDPIALLQCLYRIEQLPYLIHIASWSIDTTTQTTVTSFAGVAPSTPVENVARQGSSLEADIVVSTVR